MAVVGFFDAHPESTDYIDLATLPVHPAAELFPMMDDDALAELAEDIAEKGQMHPIVVAMIGDPPTLTLIDGRNRLKACQLAGVEPKVTFLNDQDPITYILSTNAKRRMLTKGQLAMVAALAELFSKNNRQHAVAEATGVSQSRVAYAEMVVQFAPEQIEAVRSGATSLNVAYEIARKNKADKKAAQEQEAKRLAQMDELRQYEPELADKVIEGEMTLEAALAEWEKRKAARRKEVEGANWKATQILTLLGSNGSNHDEQATKLLDLIDPKAVQAPMPWNVENVEQCLGFLTAIRDVMRRHEEQ
jgi:hypothetical protein